MASDTRRGEWDPDPLVVVSARTRNLNLPKAVLYKDISEEQVRVLVGMRDLDRAEKTLTLLAGVTFLGALTTSWALRGSSPGQAPRDAPARDSCILITPPYNDTAEMLRHKTFVDPDTGRPDPAIVAAAWLRAMSFLRTQERVLNDMGTPTPCALFTTQDGAMAPEVIVCHLSEVLSQNTTDGRHGYAYTMRSIRHAKDGTHLGALHDYAVRNFAASSIVDACRQRAQKCGPAFVGQR